MKENGKKDRRRMKRQVREQHQGRDRDPNMARMRTLLVSLPPLASPNKTK